MTRLFDRALLAAYAVAILIGLYLAAARSDVDVYTCPYGEGCR